MSEYDRALSSPPRPFSALRFCYPSSFSFLLACLWCFLPSLLFHVCLSFFLLFPFTYPPFLFPRSWLLTFPWFLLLRTLPSFLLPSFLFSFSLCFLPASLGKNLSFSPSFVFLFLSYSSFLPNCLPLILSSLVYLMKILGMWPNLFSRLSPSISLTSIHTY